MTDVAESKLFSHSFGPLFNCATFDFNCVATALAHKVVMMRVTAQAVNSFAIFTAQQVDDLVIN
jgi:hypothetical protein